VKLFPFHAGAVLLLAFAVDVAAQEIPQTTVRSPVVQSPGGVALDPCSVGRDAQPNVTRWTPNGRVWPGGRVVFYGQGLDASRFVAVIGSAPQAIALNIVSATATRIETVVPTLPEGGPYTPSTGSRLTVSYRGSSGCRLLNPGFVVADAFTVSTSSAGANGAYFWIRHPLNFNGAIEGVRSVRILNHLDQELRDRPGNISEYCHWVELPRSSRLITLRSNDIRHIVFGYMFDQRVGSQRSQSFQCKLPVDVVVQDPATNVSLTEQFLIPMTIRNPRVLRTNSHRVLHRFQGVEPLIENPGAAMGDCGKLYEGDYRGGPEKKIGVTVQDGEWVFSIRSGVIPTRCRYNSLPVEAQNDVALGEIHWQVSKQGNPSRCSASVEPTGAINHTLESFEVYLFCDPGPLGDNGVTVRATGADVLVPYDSTPAVFSREPPF